MVWAKHYYCRQVLDAEELTDLRGFWFSTVDLANLEVSLW